MAAPDAARVPDPAGFVHTGPGSLAGAYLRRHWQPVYVAGDLAPGAVVPIRIMEESFTLYRDQQGKPHVTAPNCPHRGTQLSTAVVEGEHLRCVYHGWMFDAAGQCVEQPGEPRPFCHKIRITSYPTAERFGLIFVMLDSHSPPPPLAGSDALDGCVVRAVMLRHACNYFQRAENNVDGIHVRFTHRAAPGLGQSTRGALMPTGISAHETAWGLTQVLEYPGARAEMNHFIMPNGSYFTWEYGTTGLRIHNRLWYVPIDDESHHLFVVTLVADDRLRRLLHESSPHLPLDAAVDAVLSGRSSFQSLDLSRQDLILVQDAIVTCGLGAIADRRREHLGRTDVAVVLLRNLWRRELRALRDGTPLTAFNASPLELPVQ